MRTAFADTFYFLALLDTTEARHTQAAEAARDPELRLGNHRMGAGGIRRCLLPSE